MRSFRKPGRYKRNLHSTYCREHPLVKSLSNIYPCLLKGLSLIAREVSSKKGNNIPFITSNFRKKKGQGRGCYSLLYFSLYPSNSFNSFHFLRFRIHHGTFSKPIYPFYHSIIRYSHILRSISIFSPLLHPSSHPLFYLFSLLSFFFDLHRVFSSTGAALIYKFECRAISNYTPTHEGGCNWSKQVEGNFFCSLGITLEISCRLIISRGS